MILVKKGIGKQLEMFFDDKVDSKLKEVFVKNKTFKIKNIIHSDIRVNKVGVKDGK